MNNSVSNSNNSSRTSKLWQIPPVVSITASYTRYKEPKLRVVKGRVEKKTQAIELQVRTAAEFPARGFSPALFIGEKMLAEYEMTGSNLYKFYAFDMRGLQEGTPIYIGWPNFPATKIRTRFNFRLDRPNLV